MNTLNSFILKKFLTVDNRKSIKTSCDLYLNLGAGYLCVISILGFVGVYLTGLINLIVLDKGLPNILFYKTMNGDPKNFTELSMAIFSCINGLLAFLVVFGIFIAVTIACLFLMIMFFDIVSNLISKINWIAKPFCRELTSEEKNKILNVG